jgi:AcrR family transcriptional regulator
VTLRLLQQCGFDGVTVEAIAVAAHSSKATIYRRWPCKADLVVAAFVEGIPEISDPPDTGTLRGDLLHLGNILCDHVNRQSSTLPAVIGEASRHPALKDALQSQLLDHREGVVEHVLGRTVDRGEIDAAAITNELRDLLPGYLLYRSVVSNRPPRARPSRPSSRTRCCPASRDPPNRASPRPVPHDLDSRDRPKRCSHLVVR